ncbi:MAG: hypothetical protein AAGF24_01780 [Cyanobacteria bacterium P01_H01_bin.121]
MSRQQWNQALSGSLLASRLLFAGILGISGYALQAAIAPQAAQSYTARLDVTIDPDENENYQTFLRRAEVIARAAAQRSFDNDILVTDVEIFVIGRGEGLEVPLLSLSVSRFEWSRRPDTAQWATYYPASRNFLDLRFSATTP